MVHAYTFQPFHANCFLPKTCKCQSHDFTFTLPNHLHHAVLQLLTRGGGVIALLALALNSSAAPAPTLSLTLVASNYNGYNISCFGMKDGGIDLSVSGGTAPYSYRWSNGAVSEDIGELAAGYYKVDVQDSNGEYATAEITLEQPLPMKLDVDVYEYPNGYNVSCFDCYNGNASVVVMGGAAPFTVSWSDGPTGMERYNLGPKDYKITVADANGCGSASTTIYLRGPARSDWSMTGNANTLPGQQYIGTPDNKDLVFKSNGMERLRLMANGAVKLSNNSLANGSLYLDPNGELRSFGFEEADPVPSTPCAMGVLTSGIDPHWRVGGNYFAWPQCDETTAPRLGTKQALDLDFITTDQVRMVISRNGKVGIGTIPDIAPVGDYRLFVENGIVCRDVLVKLGTWPDYVFEPNYALMPLHEMRDFLRDNKHLPGIPSAAELEAKQGVEVGDLQTRMLKVLEEQALYILQLEEKQAGLEQRIMALEASQR